MNYDKMAKFFMEEGLTNAELTFYNRNNGNLVKNTIRFDISADDYQWSISAQPIKMENTDDE